MSWAIGRRVINKFVSQAIGRHMINKSVSPAIGCHVIGKNHKFPREISKEKKLRAKMQYIIFMHLFKMLLHYFDVFDTCSCHINNKSQKNLCAKSMVNIKQLKAQVSHLGCEKKKNSVLKH